MGQLPVNYETLPAKTVLDGPDIISIYEDDS
jgi:hypothetical protein